MIITKIIGGLGNQMFQYAAGRSLAHRYKVPLLLDISAFQNYKVHQYALKHFNIQERFATAEQLAKLSPIGYSKITEKLASILGKSLFWVQREKQFHFDQSIFNAPDNTYLDGYWQSDKYFQDIKNLIRSEFTIRTETVEENMVLAQHIQSTNAVSLHIRRGDYISNPKANEFHGTCSMDYYKQAVTFVAARVVDPTFFCFSDDIQWAKNNLSVDYPMIFVEGNNERNYEDFRLMTMCKHHIIANSTFSWWTAWLSDNKSKLVIAPKKWFLSGSHNTKDLIPEEWIRI